MSLQLRLAVVLCVETWGHAGNVGRIPRWATTDIGSNKTGDMGSTSGGRLTQVVTMRAFSPIGCLTPSKVMSSKLALVSALLAVVFASALACGRPPTVADIMWSQSDVRHPRPSPQRERGRRLVVARAPFSMFVPLGLVQIAQGTGFREVCDDVSVSVMRAPTSADVTKPHSILPGAWSVSRVYHDGWVLNEAPLALELAQNLQHDPPMEAWVVAIPVADAFYIWTATYPSSLAGEYRAKLKTALRSILIDTSPRTQLVQFDLETEGLVLLADFWNARPFIRDGSTCPPSLDSPILQVSAVRTVRDQRSDSARRLRGMGAKQLVQKDAFIRIDNLEGIESFATGQDTSPKAYGTMLLYQAVLFDEEWTYLIQGRVAKSYPDAPKWLTRFRASARTFHRVPGPLLP